MANHSTRRVLLASAVCTLLNLTRAATETCMSQQGYVFQPKPPRRKALTKPLSFCTQYSRRTCCSPMITDRIMRLSALAKAAEHSVRCRRMSELMACSVCHPDVGTGKLRTVCTRTCDEWYSACEQEFYSANSDGTLRPCFGNALVCSPLSYIAQSGTAFCKRMGYLAAGSIDAAAEAERQLTLGKSKKRVVQGKDISKVVRAGSSQGRELNDSANMDNGGAVDSEAIIDTDDRDNGDTDDGDNGDTDEHATWGLDGEDTENLDTDADDADRETALAERARLITEQAEVMCFDGTVPPGDGMAEPEEPRARRKRPPAWHAQDHTPLWLQTAACLGALLCIVLFVIRCGFFGTRHVHPVVDHSVATPIDANVIAALSQAGACEGDDDPVAAAMLRSLKQQEDKFD